MLVNNSQDLTLSRPRLRQIVAVLLAIGFCFECAQSAPATNYDAPGVTLSEPLTVRWRYDSGLSLNLTPAFDAERIYVPLAGGILVALRAKDGQLYWRSEIGGELSASPAADNDQVYVASETGSTQTVPSRPTGVLRALGREGGVTQWMTPLVMPLRGSLTLSGNKIFAGGSDGRIYAFDKQTGGVYWSIPHGAPFNCQPAAKDGRVYFGSEDGNLLAVEEPTGKLIWRFRTKGWVRGAIAVIGSAVYFGSGDGYVYAVNSGNGRLLWRKRTGAGVQAVMPAAESLLVASLDNFVYLFHLNGARLWKRQMPGRISAQPLAIEDAALFTPLSSSAGVVLALRDGRQVNSLPTGEEITTSASPVSVGDVVFLTTVHGLLAFAQPKDSTASKSPPR
jgi:outer membrane protein assembly factor BamB